MGDAIPEVIQEESKSCATVSEGDNSAVLCSEPEMNQAQAQSPSIAAAEALEGQYKIPQQVVHLEE